MNGDAKLESKTRERIFQVIYDLTKKDVIDYVLKTLQKAENYWRFLQRGLLANGVHVSSSSFIDVDYREEDGEGKYVVIWKLEVFIPESLIQFIAELRRRKKWKPPKEHPVVRQRAREGEDVAEEMGLEDDNINIVPEDNS